jgi:5'-3' exonuclease
VTVIFDSKYVCYVYRFAFSKGMQYLGNPTQIIFGFIREIIRQITNYSPDNLIFCWDSDENVRKAIRPEYKENRTLKPDDDDGSREKAYEQFDLLEREILPYLGFKNIYNYKGYESDDLIASIVINRPDRYLVVSGDEDLFQLLDYCSIYDIRSKSTTTKTLFERQYGIKPSDWVNVKAIAGCHSDNVEGLSGVGEKGMIDYLAGRMKVNQKYLKISDAMLFKNPHFQDNLKLVKLPFSTTPVPPIFDNQCTIQSYMDICNEFGLKSLIEPQGLNQWRKICHK